jgi:hypothetical protein
MTRSEEIAAIELTPEEIVEAIMNAKISKWNRERNAEYWNELEKKKPEKNNDKRVH